MRLLDQKYEDTFEACHGYTNATGEMPQAGEVRHSYADGMAIGIRFTLEQLAARGELALPPAS